MTRPYTRLAVFFKGAHQAQSRALCAEGIDRACVLMGAAA